MTAQERHVNSMLEDIAVMAVEYTVLERECQRVRAEAERLARENAELRNLLQAAAFSLDEYASDISEAVQLVDRIADLGGLAREMQDVG
jgi:hypothetical protein